jgi:hypothetical protein
MKGVIHSLDPLGWVVLVASLSAVSMMDLTPLPFVLVAAQSSSSSGAEACRAAGDCQSCLNTLGCGWCSTSGPFSSGGSGGECDAGSQSGPSAGSCSGSWNFYSCPTPAPIPPPLIFNGSWLGVAASPNRRRFVDLRFNLVQTPELNATWSNYTIYGSQWYSPVVHAGVVYFLGSELGTDSGSIS